MLEVTTRKELPVLCYQTTTNSAVNRNLAKSIKVINIVSDINTDTSFNFVGV